MKDESIKPLSTTWRRIRKATIKENNEEKILDLIMTQLKHKSAVTKRKLGAKYKGVKL